MTTAKILLATAAILVSLPSLALAQTVVISPYYGGYAQPYYGGYSYNTQPYYGGDSYAQPYDGGYSYAQPYSGYYGYAPSYYGYAPGYRILGWQRVY